ncbi:MAG: response regulator [candidate division Zixibacteria bacterium]|nr:response regulator [candidate division Zixibacteria bacterium]
MRERILIVDDTPVIREFLQEFFVDSGFDADIAKNGREGLELSLSNDYSLILSDVHMPEMSGMEMITKLRMTKPDVPIIMMDSLPNKQARLAAESGAQGCLAKPFDLDELRLMVEQITNAKHTVTK